MKFHNKLLLAVILLFIVANLFIFINRNNGFEYKKVSNKQELYPVDLSASFLNKWTNYNKRFSSEELKEGFDLLNQAIGIDTISNDGNKVMRIAGWLYNSFRQQKGESDSLLVEQTPLQQFYYLSAHKEKKLWCGNFQAMVGFFCTAAMLPNRYVEIAPMNNDLDTHEVNEVYLAEIKKWVMVDATRNFLLIKKEDQLFSVAEYLDHNLKKNKDELFFIESDTISGYDAYESVRRNGADKYFNEDHFLRYYYTLDLSKIYALWQKIKRYFLADPWYEIYSPGEHYSNLLFRTKQFCFFGIGVVIILLVFLKPKLKR